MQAIVETLFGACYLTSVITIGILMIAGSKGNRQFSLFGWMAVLLGCGDAFHLVPRALALCTTGLENYTVRTGKMDYLCHYDDFLSVALPCLASAVSDQRAKCSYCHCIRAGRCSDCSVHDAAKSVVEC